METQRRPAETGSHPPRRRAALVAVLLALPLAAVLAVVLTRPGDHVLPGVAVDGHDVGGLTHDELETAVSALADERLDQPVVLLGERDELSLSHAEAGLHVEVPAIVEEAWAHGRGPPAGWWQRLAARLGATWDVPLATDVDDGLLEQAAADAAEALSEQPRDAAIALDPGPDDGAEVDVTQPEAGERVDETALAERLDDEVRTRGPAELEVPGEVEEPVVTAADLDAAEPAARTIVSAPVELTNPAGGDDVTLTAADLARLVEFAARPDEPEGERLVPVVDRDAFDELVAARSADLEVEPVEADIALEDGEVRISGGTAGYSFDGDAVAEQVLEVARRTDDRTEPLAGPQPEPEFTRADAEDLQITEEVASFTTEYDCCPPRVTNIQLMADIVDGALIRPGERFSLNDHAGPRTAERGFVPGGAIIDGEFEDVVGGGTSQFATTFFNAAFFTGVELVEFQPHSYYFPRYPMGRESTISYGAIDVVIENDSPYGILVESLATETSVTVAFWSSPWAEVEAFDSGPYNEVPGETRDGFDIDFGRAVTYPDGSTAEEEWFHRYEPQD